MDDELRRTSREPFEGPGHYIPVDALHSIVTLDAIRQILPCVIKNGTPDSVDRMAQEILGRYRGEHEMPKSYRRIFAILVLIKKADSIVEFVKEEVTDAQLPLRKVGTGRPVQLSYSNNEESIRLFQEWKDYDIEMFENKQWETLAPFFSMGINEDNLVRLYQLSWRHPLPFEIIPEGTDTSKREERPTNIGSPRSDFFQGPFHSMKGGHGKVWKVRICQGQHSLPSYRVRDPPTYLLFGFNTVQNQGNEENPALAIKRLLAADRKTFQNEVNILTQLNKCNDPHLVKLLLAIEILGQPGHNSSFFLVFPFADSNLRQFWERNFPHPEGTNTATYAPWVAKQLYGLAWALCKLHHQHQREVHSLKYEDDDRINNTGDTLYGIHGDIKPENFLWYKEWAGPNGAQAAQDSAALEGSPRGQESKGSFGILQLSDFGNSKLHHAETGSSHNMRRSTKSYAAPEVEWTGNGDSRAFDIWGLGCVFLEFICWLVQGGSGTTNPVEVFHHARYLQRTNRSLEGTIQDTFYHVVKGKDTTKFELNPAVKKV